VTGRPVQLILPCPGCGSPAEPADSGLFGVSTVEAAFAVSIDRAGRWRLREVRIAPGRS